MTDIGAFLRALPLLVAAPASAQPTIAALDPAEVARRGADLPIVEYEAETAVTNGILIGPDRRFGALAAEASGRRAVRLAGRGQYVAFRLDRAANALTLRYAIPDSAEGGGIDASIGVEVAGQRIGTLALTSRYGWFYGRYPFTNRPADGGGHHFFDHARLLLGRTLPAGTTVRLALGKADRVPWVAVDLVDFELAPPPLARPAGSISLADFPCAQDCTDAFRRAVTQAAASGRTLWIPPGRYHVRGHVTLDRVTIQGAGLWHSELRGEGLGLYGREKPAGQAITLHDFALIGEVTERRDEVPLSGIGGAMGGGTVIERLWLQHHKVGVWLDGPMDGIRLSQLRILDMTADGLNFHRGVRNALIEHSLIRGTGDDGLAAWSGSGEANRDVTFRNNTVIAPVLANGIAVYGGSDIRIERNLVADSLTQGGGIHLGNRFKAVPLGGRIAISDNVIARSGSFDPNWRHGVGALWFYALDAPIDAAIEVTGLDVIDSSEEAVLFTGSSVSGVTLRNLRVRGSAGPVMTLRSAGAARVENVGTKDAPLVVACNPAFRLAWAVPRETGPCGAR